MSTLRFAILTAVSSRRQASPDKISLEVQQDVSRQHARDHGWYESAGPYVIPGERRTRYVNLRDAINDIPQLRTMIEDAQRSAFDLLVIYDFTRLRDLVDPVAQALAAYGVQVYSCRQPVEPVPPDKFSRKVSGSSAIIQTISLLGSRTEIDTLTARTRAGREGRIPKGLHPSGPIPYGYKYATTSEKRSSVPLVIDPSRAEIVVKIKDLFLSGYSVGQIIDYLETNHIPAPTGRGRWSDGSLRYMLHNPFYAGEVGIGYHRKRHDPLQNITKAIVGDPEQVARNTGHHEPLWDMDTMRAIEAETRRRSINYKGRATYRLSLLLYCGEHNRAFYVRYVRGIWDDDHRIWYCNLGEPGHWHRHIMDTDALEKLSRQLVSDLENIEHLIKMPEPSTPTELVISAIDDLRARRERLTDALEMGTLDANTYAERTTNIDTRIRELRATQQANENALQNQKQRVNGLSQLAQLLRDVPDFISTADPQLVNTQLRSLISRIIVHADGQIEILYR